MWYVFKQWTILTLILTTSEGMSLGQFIRPKESYSSCAEIRGSTPNTATDTIGRSIIRPIGKEINSNTFAITVYCCIQLNGR